MRKRQPDWAEWLATWFGIGRLQPGQGTWAALTALPLHWLMQGWPVWVQLVLLALVIAGGFWSAGRVARSHGHHDPQIIVIDEAAGALLALWLVGGCGWVAEVAALLGFRALDIWKPWPVGPLERLEPAALAVMGDDLMAGLLAGLGVLAAFRIIPLI